MKSLQYNEQTKEIKAIERKTVRSKTEYVKELTLDEIRNLDEKHPVKMILNVLESLELKNNNVNVSEIKNKLGLGYF